MAVTAAPGMAGTDSLALLQRAIRLFLLLLVCGDLVYMALHIGHLTTPALSGRHFSLEVDGGLAEFYQYTKELWLALCLAIAFHGRRHPVLLAWSGFFGFLLLDDALRLHERMGIWLGRRFGLPAVAGLRPDDFGELLVAAVVAGSLLAVLALAWWRDRESTWRLSRRLLILTVALGVCGVIVDTLHVIAYFRAPAISDLLAFIEDGGELLIVSLLATHALDLAIGSGEPLELRRLLLGGPQPVSAEAA